MKDKKITQQTLDDFSVYLREGEKSRATIEKYLRDVRCFFCFAKGREITKALTMEYKLQLREKYAAVSANSMIASLNSFLRFAGLDSCCVKQFKLQRKIFCSEEKELTREEYFRLIHAAKTKGSERLSLLIETICATGIRVSELQYITAAAVRRGEATVSCKGKTRTGFYTQPIAKEADAIYTGTKNRIRRRICYQKRKTDEPLQHLAGNEGALRKSGCSARKGFSRHNLRHLFARTFYGIEKDIVKLADILGHSSINTTRIYIVTTGEEHRRKIDGMHLIL